MNICYLFHKKLVPEVFMMVQCYQGSYRGQVEDVNNNEKNSEKRKKNLNLAENRLSLQGEL